MNKKITHKEALINFLKPRNIITNRQFKFQLKMFYAGRGRIKRWGFLKIKVVDDIATITTLTEELILAKKELQPDYSNFTRIHMIKSGTNYDNIVFYCDAVTGIKRRHQGSVVKALNKNDFKNKYLYHSQINLCTNCLNSLKRSIKHSKTVEIKKTRGVAGRKIEETPKAKANLKKFLKIIEKGGIS